MATKGSTPHASSVAASLRDLRVIYLCMFAASGAYIWIAAQWAGQHAGATALTPQILHILQGLAVVDALGAYFFYQRFVAPTRQALRTDSADSAAIKKWRSGHILCWVLAMSISLYGLVFRILGATSAQSWFFFGLSLLMFVPLWPRDPAGA